MKKNILLLYALILAANHAFSQISLSDYPFDLQVPALAFNNQARLTLLQGRFGSRFSCSLVTSEKAMHTGSMGFDYDDTRELLVELEVAGKKACFMTASLPANTEYLSDQQINYSLNAIKLTGKHPSGATLTVTFLSPFTVSNTLEEEEQVKTQIVPAYLISVQTDHLPAGKAVVRVGWKANPFDRGREGALSIYPRFKQANQIFYRDPSNTGGLLVLAGMQKENLHLKHFQEEAFHGLSKEITASSDEEVFIYATHHAGKVIRDEKTNQNLRFYYNKFWKNLDEVTAFVRSNAATLIQKSAKFEQLLLRSSLSANEKGLLGIAFRTDLANCFFLLGKGAEPRFYEVEGRFRHISTVDVAMETELNALFAPWRLKLQLEQWTNYLATKEVMVPSTRLGTSVKENVEGITASEYGFYIYHDVGDFPHLFEAEGYNFGPCSPVEENASFIQLLYWYWKITQDTAFVRRHAGMVDLLMYSMKNRDGDGSGIADGGIGWTTYDVSEAIKRAPENTYLGTREMVAYLMGSELLKISMVKPDAAIQKILIADDEDGTTLDGNGKAQFIKARNDNRQLRLQEVKTYETEANKIASTLMKANKKYGYIPVSLDRSFNGWDQYSITIPEGLFYAGLTGFKHPIIQRALPALQNTYQKAFDRSVTSYGIKLSSGESVTWFSKVMVSDVVATVFFKKPVSTAKYTYEWNKNNASAYQDGAYDPTKAWEGNWYPRGISCLGYFLLERGFKGDRKPFTDGLR